jgi:hypothetical protein
MSVVEFLWMGVIVPFCVSFTAVTLAYEIADWYTDR